MLIISLIVVFVAIGLKQNSLTLLLCLELLRLLLVIRLIVYGVELFYSLLLVCIGACEGAVGLGALVRLSRYEGLSLYGNDAIHHLIGSFN